jgi:hypothetical protein
MAHIKYACIFSYGCMFIVDAAVADGHMITGKRGHLGAERNVFPGERSILHAFYLVRKNK